MNNLSVSNIDIQYINSGYASNFSMGNSSVGNDESIGGRLYFTQGEGGLTLSENYGDWRKSDLL
jgi:hypothetical protein